MGLKSGKDMKITSPEDGLRDIIGEKMREIKFRGKRKDNDEWVYGGLLEDHRGSNIINFTHNESLQISKYEVIPETAGQYTGLKDKNDNEIYEEDIVKIFRGVLKTHNFIVEFDSKLLRFVLDFKGLSESKKLKVTSKKRVEVIGNKYENLELLEKK